MARRPARRSADGSAARPTGPEAVEQGVVALPGVAAEDLVGALAGERHGGVLAGQPAHVPGGHRGGVPERAVEGAEDAPPGRRRTSPGSMTISWCSEPSARRPARAAGSSRHRPGAGEAHREGAQGAARRPARRAPRRCWSRGRRTGTPPPARRPRAGPRTASAQHLRQLVRGLGERGAPRDGRGSTSRHAPSGRRGRSPAPWRGAVSARPRRRTRPGRGSVGPGNAEAPAGPAGARPGTLRPAAPPAPRRRPGCRPRRQTNSGLMPKRSRARVSRRRPRLPQREGEHAVEARDRPDAFAVEQPQGHLDVAPGTERRPRPARGAAPGSCRSRR